MGAVHFEPDDRFLLCTDGIVDGFHDELLLDHLRSPVADGKSPAQSLVEASSKPRRSLVEAAVQASGRDNTTALVIDIAKS